MVDKSVSEIKEQVKTMFHQFTERSIAINLDDKMVIDGLEIDMDKSGKIYPTAIMKEALEKDGTFRVPVFLDGLENCDRCYIPSYAEWTRNRNIFAKCDGLKRIVFESPDIALKNYALMNCSSLEYADMSVFSVIPTGFFRYCNKLRVVDIRNAEVIERQAFEGCIRLEKLIISSKLRSVRRLNFYDVDIENFEIEVVDELSKHLYISKSGNRNLSDSVRKYKREHR